MNPAKLRLEELIEVRMLAKRAITDYLDENGWLEVTSTTITSLTGACETISTVFTLDYFERRAHLAQTAQLQLEMLVKELKRRIWTFDHSFRAEPRLSHRHLTEFCLFEIEAPGFTLSDIIATQEAVLRTCISRIVGAAPRLSQILQNRVDFLQSIKFPLRVVEYRDAIDILQSVGISRAVGDNLGMEEEQALLQHFEQMPFFLTKFPAEIKYFNMRRSDDATWVYSTDLIAPPFGEISGGAEREDEFEKVTRNLRSSEMWLDIERLGLDKDHFEWYLGLWKDGSPGPRGGFGIGFERLTGFLTGNSDVRDCIEFTRNRASIFP